MKININEATKIFDRINVDLSPKYRGKIVAIDAESGKYFIGDSELTAYKKAIRKYPKKQFFFKRIGFKSTHVVGAL